MKNLLAWVRLFVTALLSFAISTAGLHVPDAGKPTGPVIPPNQVTVVSPDGSARVCYSHKVDRLTCLGDEMSKVILFEQHELLKGVKGE